MAAAGALVDVHRDLHVRMNGQNPWRVVYEFATRDGTRARGIATSWDPERPRVEVGQRVIVLHDPARPSRSALWTRLDEPARAELRAPTFARIAVDAAANEADPSDEEADDRAGATRGALR